jgi:hypothetical protein
MPARGRIYAKMFHVKHRSAPLSPMNPFSLAPRLHRRPRRDASREAFLRKRMAARGLKNAILQNNPMHQKIVQQNQRCDYAHLGAGRAP